MDAKYINTMLRMNEAGTIIHEQNYARGITPSNYTTGYCGVAYYQRINSGYQYTVNFTMTFLITNVITGKSRRVDVVFNDALYDEYRLEDIRCGKIMEICMTELKAAYEYLLQK